MYKTQRHRCFLRVCVYVFLFFVFEMFTIAEIRTRLVLVTCILLVMVFRVLCVEHDDAEHAEPPPPRYHPSLYPLPLGNDYTISSTVADINHCWQIAPFRRCRDAEVNGR